MSTILPALYLHMIYIFNIASLGKLSLSSAMLFSLFTKPHGLLDFISVVVASPHLE